MNNFILLHRNFQNITSQSSEIPHDQILPEQPMGWSDIKMLLVVCLGDVVTSKTSTIELV